MALIRSFTLCRHNTNATIIKKAKWPSLKAPSIKFAESPAPPNTDGGNFMASTMDSSVSAGLSKLTDINIELPDARLYPASLPNMVSEM